MNQNRAASKRQHEYALMDIWTPVEAAMLTANLRPTNGTTQLPEQGAIDFEGELQFPDSHAFKEARRILSLWNAQPNAPSAVTPLEFLGWCLETNEDLEDWIDTSWLEAALPDPENFDEISRLDRDMRWLSGRKLSPEEIIEKWDEELDARIHLRQPEVSPEEAALLLCQIEPISWLRVRPSRNFNDVTLEKQYEALLHVFRSKLQFERDKVWTLLDWLQLAKDRRLKYSDWIDEYIKACKALGYDLSQAALPPTSHRTQAKTTEPKFEVALREMHLFGIEMERHPQTHVNNNECDLRNNFLNYLNARFGGNATGESTNGEGRTDILLRIDGKNELIGECKCWDGPKTVSDAIDQVLRYATTRDGQLAIVVFNRDGTKRKTVQDGIEHALKSHKHYLQMEPWDCDRASRCMLKHPRDESCECLLSVMFFDIPRKTGQSDKAQ